MADNALLIAARDLAQTREEARAQELEHSTLLQALLNVHDGAWDTCAALLLLDAADLEVTGVENSAFRYSKVLKRGGERYAAPFNEELNGCLATLLLYTSPGRVLAELRSHFEQRANEAGQVERKVAGRVVETALLASRGGNVANDRLKPWGDLAKTAPREVAEALFR